MSERATDPYGAHRFRVVSDALPEELGFTEVRGLSVRVADREDDGPDAVEVGREGRLRWPGGDRSSGQLETHSPTLELRRGVSEDRSLWGWLQSWVVGEVDPQDVRVCLLDGQGRPVRGWVCRAARPVRWRGPDLVAGRTAVATETVTLAHDGIEAVTDLAEFEP